MKVVSAVASITVILFLAGCSSSPVTSDGTPLTIATFNVHYVTDRQVDMRWEDRREAVLHAALDTGADIIAFQEMETFAGGSYNQENRQLLYLQANMSEYAVAAVGNPRDYPSTQPVFVRAGRFEVQNRGFFFFSDTPDVIYSRSWDGRFPAFCSWVRLYDKTADSALLVFNVHFDAGSGGNRRKAASLVANRVGAIASPAEPVIVVGDFNAAWFFPTLRRVADAGLSVAHTRGSTFHFYRGLRILPAIDHVLYSSEFVHQQTRVLRDRHNGVFPSDHYPVVVDLLYQ